MSYLTREQLEKLPRGKLQAIAKEHNIKANQKSALIIEEYLSKLDAKEKGYAPASQTHPRDGALPAIKQESSPVDKMGRGRAPSPSTKAARRQQVREGRQRPTEYYVEEGNSESDEECDEQELQETVEIIKTREAQDNEIIENIRLLRAATAMAKEKIEKLKQLLVAQRSRREMMEKYITYSQPVKGGWPLEAVYCGDENGELHIQYKTNPSIQEERYIEIPEEWEDDYVPLAERLPEYRNWKKRRAMSATVPIELAEKAPAEQESSGTQKRRRDDDDEAAEEEKERSAARPRLSRDLKGKGKMAPEEVLALNAENKAAPGAEVDEREELDRIIVMNRLLAEKKANTASSCSSFVPPGHRSYDIPRYPSKF